MELDERKRKILKAIIQNYQETGEPVGSRTISKLTDLSLSSATIRNEMSDLEEMGLIVQPHTSAGRVPTDLAYRMYVDSLMKEEREGTETKNELTTYQDTNSILLKRMDRLELMLEQVAKVVAANTNYTAMVSSPRYSHSKLKFIQLSLIEPFKMLAVIVTEGNIIKNSMFDIEEELTEQDLLSLNLMLNTHLNGLTLEEINLGVITHLSEQAGTHKAIVTKVLEAVAKAIKPDRNMDVYTSGTTNIFRYPELIGDGKASDILDAFEEKEQMAELLTNSLKTSGQDGIQVFIGDETSMESMKDCSVVTSTYELADGLKGTIAIVGPKRMDYEKVMDTLSATMTQLNALFRKDEAVVTDCDGEDAEAEEKKE